MKLIAARYRDRFDFLRAVEPKPGAGALRVDTRARLEPGDPALLEVHYPGLPSIFVLRAMAASTDDGLPRFVLAPGEREVREHLVAFSQGTSLRMVQRTSRRLPMRLHADVEGHTATGGVVSASGVTEDVSALGLLVRTRLSLPIGTRVRVLLTLDDGRGDSAPVDGDVVWARPGDRSVAYGVRFRRRSGDGFRRYRMMLRRVKEQGRSPDLSAAEG